MKNLTLTLSVISLLFALPVKAQYGPEQTIWSGIFNGETVLVYWNNYAKYFGWISDSDSGVISCRKKQVTNGKYEELDEKLRLLLLDKACNLNNNTRS